MLKIFEGVRDVLLRKEEENITENKAFEDFHLPALNECNVLVLTEGLQEGASYKIKIEESSDQITYDEIGTFVVPAAQHGLLFAKEKDFIKCTVMLEEGQNLNVAVNF